MKLKKFFAGVLAAAMMLTVGATAAFATEPAAALLLFLAVASMVQRCLLRVMQTLH